jgi:hypothetical protein
LNAELWIAAACSFGMAVQLVGGIALLPGGRSRFQRWLHDDDSENLVHRAHQPVMYWLIIAIECAGIAYLWWLGFTGVD